MGLGPSQPAPPSPRRPPGEAEAGDRCIGQVCRIGRGQLRCYPGLEVYSMSYINWNAQRASTVTPMRVGAARVPTKENRFATSLVPTPCSAVRADGVHT